MLNKEECEKAQAILCNYKDYQEEADPDEVSWSVSVFADLIFYHFNPQPYKFEDLKVGMWVWDSVKQRCLKIKKTIADCLGQRIVTCYSINESIYYPLNFEDNRFFPVQMANREVEEHERSGVYDL